MRHRFKRNHPVTFGGFTLIEAFGLPVERIAKLAASTKAQARYLLPFLLLPWPFF